MAKTDALARVEVDLARGRTHPAIQRLSSLVTRHPTDLDLRLRLAAAHRTVGNRIEAGRWAYLDAAADPAEITAFERAFPDPTRRLTALRWPHGAGAAPTEYARRRLDALVASARPVGSPAGPSVPRLGPALLIVALLAAVVFAAVGAVTLVQWLS